MAKPKQELQELMAKTKERMEEFSVSLTERYSDDEISYMLTKTLHQLTTWQEQQSYLLQHGYDAEDAVRAFERTLERGRLLQELQAWRNMGAELGMHPDEAMSKAVN